MGFLIGVFICGASFCLIYPLAALLLVAVIPIEAVKYYFYCRDGVDSVHSVQDIIFFSLCSMCGFSLALISLMCLSLLYTSPLFIYLFFSAIEVLYTCVVYREMIFATDPRIAAARAEDRRNAQHDSDVRYLVDRIQPGAHLKDYTTTSQTELHALADRRFGNL